MLANSHTGDCLQSFEVVYSYRSIPLTFSTETLKVHEEGWTHTKINLKALCGISGVKKNPIKAPRNLELAEYFCSGVQMQQIPMAIGLHSTHGEDIKVRELGVSQ